MRIILPDRSVQTISHAPSPIEEILLDLRINPTSVIVMKNGKIVPRMWRQNMKTRSGSSGSRTAGEPLTPHSILMNVLRGDLTRLVHDTSTGHPDQFVPRIKPLAVLSEKEIVTYLLIRGYYRDLPECPYAGTALRSEVRSMLACLEQKHPGTMTHLMQFRNGVRRSAHHETAKDLPTCRLCGELTSGEVCQVCRMLEQMGEQTPGSRYSTR